MMTGVMGIRSLSQKEGGGLRKRSEFGSHRLDYPRDGLVFGRFSSPEIHGDARGETGDAWYRCEALCVS